jgi:hypothetical protein
VCGATDTGTKLGFGTSDGVISGVSDDLAELRCSEDCTAGGGATELGPRRRDELGLSDEEDGGGGNILEGSDGFGGSGVGSGCSLDGGGGLGVGVDGGAGTVTVRTVGGGGVGVGVGVLMDGGGVGDDVVVVASQCPEDQFAMMTSLSI